MRTKQSVINIVVSCTSYLILMLCTFITRGVFSRVLGLDYAGVESTFLNLVSMLAIVELGLGTGIIYKLYKPIADGDNRKIGMLLRFYKQSYLLIAAIVFVLGIVAAFIAPQLVHDEQFPKAELAVYFMFYVLDVLASYLYAHKRALLTADQRNFLNSFAHMVAQVAACILQVAVLLLFQSMFLYLLVKVGGRLLENLLISHFYQKRYPHIEYRQADRLDPDEKTDLFSNIKALLMHRIASFSLQSTSSVIIMYFQNSGAAGIYGNYTLITNALINLSNQIYNGILASFGNLITTESKEKTLRNFNALYLLNYLIFSFFSIGLFVLSGPFMELWIGKDAAFSVEIVLLITVYLYLMGMRQSVFMARSSAGLYRQDRWFAIGEAVLNLVLSMIFIQFWGVIGIVAANIISLLAIPFWTQPRIVCRYVLGASLRRYYLQYVIYAAATLVSGAATYLICSLIPVTGAFARLVCYFFVCLIVPNGISLLLFRKTEGFQYLLEAAKRFLSGLRASRSAKRGA